VHTAEQCTCDKEFLTQTPGGLKIYSNKKNVIRNEHIRSHRLNFTQVAGQSESSYDPNCPECVRQMMFSAQE
jgi:hypothetical protein